MRPVDLVVTRHAPLVAYLREQGLISASTPIVEHASPEDVCGRHVLGVLPHRLSSLCALVSEVPLALTMEDRTAMQRGDLPLERVRAIAGPVVTYRVERVHD